MNPHSPHQNPTPRVPYALTARLRADMRRMIRDEWESYGGLTPEEREQLEWLWEHRNEGGGAAFVIALDDDGVPFFVEGTGVPGTHYIAIDDDGVPYITEGG